MQHLPTVAGMGQLLLPLAFSPPKKHAALCSLVIDSLQNQQGKDNKPLLKQVEVGQLRKSALVARFERSAPFEVRGKQ